MYRWWWIVLGAVIVLFTLRQVFQDLFHPAESGSISEFVARRTFGFFRRWEPLLKDSAPLSIVMVILIWAILIALGFSHIYSGLPREALRTKEGGPPQSFASILYFSFEMMTTLGLGDITPGYDYVRLLASFEALMGFAVLTASVSSIVLILPAVGRIRTLARQVSLFARDHEVKLAESGGGIESSQVLLHFAWNLERTRIDLIHFPIVYYFYSGKKDASLPRALTRLLQMARSCGEVSSMPDLQRAAGILDRALRDIADLLGRRFLKCDPEKCGETFEAFQKHHSPRK